MTKRGIVIVIILIVSIVVGFFAVNTILTGKKLLSPLSQNKPKNEEVKEKPLDKYTFENLKNRGGKKSEIKLERVLKEEQNFITYLFSYQSDGRKITGAANIPQKEGKLPVVVMFRGYVDPADYQTGIGTQPAGEYFANRGYLTLAPDFLGYGESDAAPGNNLWEDTRFLRLTASIDLLASVGSLSNADTNNIFLWGHSNGGMLVLSVLEITGGPYPTTLWAPVSQYFPYDVLYYTYEAEDKGKLVRAKLAEFEKDYDVNKYSPDEYWSWITADIQLHQSLADPYVPKSWSDNLSEKLKEQNLSVIYYTYQGANHNLQPTWDTVVERDVEFFQSHTEQ